MKRKAASILVTGLIVASLAGCGTKTEATEQTPENNASVVEVETETVTEDVTDETMSTEVIGEDTEETSSFTGAEDDNIVLYAEIGGSEFVPQSSYTYYAEAGTVTATEDVPIYNGDGINVGYIKNGASVSVSEKAQEANWSRFANPIAGTDYDYLYVNNDYIADPNEITLTAEAMKQGIIDFVLEPELGVDYVFLDEKTSDMEMYEWNMETTYSDALEYDYWLSEYLTRTIDIYDYKTLYVECEDDVDGWITCRIYYKDEVEWEQYY